MTKRITPRDLVLVQHAFNALQPLVNRIEPSLSAFQAMQVMVQAKHSTPNAEGFMMIRTQEAANAYNEEINKFADIELMNLAKSPKVQIELTTTHVNHAYEAMEIIKEFFGRLDELGLIQHDN